MRTHTRESFLETPPCLAAESSTTTHTPPPAALPSSARDSGLSIHPPSSPPPSFRALRTLAGRIPVSSRADGKCLPWKPQQKSCVSSPQVKVGCVIWAVHMADSSERSPCARGQRLSLKSNFCRRRS